MRIETDFLVVGAGVAGLSFALKAANHGRVLVLCKRSRQDSNTWYAQGGIAGVFSSQDTVEKHVQDTLVAGDGLCDEAIVRMVVGEGPQRIQELIDLGANFDRNEKGELILGKEGGHSENRILHHHDATGAEIARTLLEAAAAHPNITITENYFAADLITQHHLGYYVNRGHPDITCFGVYALDLATREVHTVLAKVTVLATGGAGNVYAATTNPTVATGDGIAMALRAKALIANMEFYQFHPTALYQPDVRPNFLITEAMRGRGAYLRDAWNKERFMHKYDSRLELAPRDVVARAIDNELKISGNPYVYLDATHLDHALLRQEFPNIMEYCRNIGIDITKDYIPVVPAAHYSCGGIYTDRNGQTSIQRLLAIGECACTGLHGANRLASNSLLEGLVFGHNAVEVAVPLLTSTALQTDVPDWDHPVANKTEEWILIAHNLKEVQSIMSNYVGIVRSNLRLERASRRIKLAYEETEAFYQTNRLSPELCELRNIVAIAYLIVKCASIRKESRGLHTNTDYPQKAERKGNTLV